MAGDWTKGVTVALDGDSGFVTIANTTQASWAMIEDWPLDEAPALDRALEVCAAVVEGRMKPEDARKAFVAAAVEAGLPMKP